MSSKPIIGINCDYRPENKDTEAFVWLHAGYFEMITASGGIPMIIPPLADPKDQKSMLQMCDGLVMIGCKLDLDPIRMGLDKHPSTRVMPPRREEFDRRLAKYAYDLKIPTLAIGSGMQTMNVVCGGTLYQHLPEDCPKAIHHRDIVESNLRHVLDIVPGTVMWKIYGEGEIRVNSDHHMAVEHIAPCFKVSATTPDGVIEGYESNDDTWYCLGVMWHPENRTASALDMQVVEELMEACQKFAGTATVPMAGKVKKVA
jgi:putative glutamine amidotransferase